VNSADDKKERTRMPGKTPLLIAIAITTFVLVMIASMATQITVSTAPAPTSVPSATAVTALDPATEALIRSREDQYRQALETAQAQIAVANAKLTETNAKLTETNAKLAEVKQPAQPVAPAEPVTTYPVSADQAAAIALDAMPNAQLIKAPELVSLQGVPAYEVVFDQGTIYIDAQTGAVQFNGMAAANGEPVTAEQAAQAASNYLGGGTVVDVKPVKKRGVDVYEVQFQDGTNIYVSTTTGQVVYAEVKSVAEHQGDDDHSEEQHDDDD
jgi:uncharacterized membrane protein YkoI